MDESAKKILQVHLHNGTLLSCVENEIIKRLSKWMKLENNHLSNVTQTQKTKYAMYSLVCTCYLFILE